MSGSQGGTQTANRPSHPSQPSGDSVKGRRRTTANPNKNSQSNASNRPKRNPNPQNNNNNVARSKQPNLSESNRHSRRATKPYIHKANSKQQRESDVKHTQIGHQDNKYSQNGEFRPQNIPDIALAPPSVPPSQLVSFNEKAPLGPLFINPQRFGFSKSHASRKPRSTPKFMFTQPRILITPPFSQDPWDKENQDTMLRMESQNNGKDLQGIYEEFQKMREVERKKMEDLGLVDAENTTKDLSEAIIFQGTCLDMCPTFERVRRALENNVKSLEKDPVTNRISRERAIKAFSRPAAGQPPPMPSDVRPPHILQKTLDYIVDNVIQDLPEAHSFIWDRTRSIRQDFTYQNFFGPEAIDCNERIVRIHLISLHVMAGSDVEYSQQQELEQLNKALQTLTEIYQDVRNNGGYCPNEAEFRAYHLISHFRDPELERELQKIPHDILKEPIIDLTLRIRGLMSQNNVVERGYTNSVAALNLFVEFFRLVYSDSTPFLLACLLETHFNEYRFYALKAMARSYHTKGKPFHAKTLLSMLGFDTPSKLVEFVTHYDVDTFHDEDGQLLVDLYNKEKLETKYKLNSFHDKPKPSQAYSSQIDHKVNGLKLKDFVNQGKPNSNLHLKTNPHTLPGKGPQKIDQTHTTRLPNSSTPLIPLIPTQTKNLMQPMATGAPLFGQAPPVQNDTVPVFKDHGNNAPQSSSKFNPPNFSNIQKANDQSMGKPMDNKPNFSFLSHPNESLKEDRGAPMSPDLFKGKTEKQHVKFGGSSSVPVLSSDPPSSLIPSASKPDHTHGVTDGLLLPTNQTHQHSQVKGSTNIPSFKPQQTTAIEKPKKLTEQPDFPKAVNKVFQEMISQVTDVELRKLLPRIMKHAHRSSERNKVIDNMASELYGAFLDEAIAITVLDCLADAINRRRLLNMSFKKLKCLSESLKKKKEHRNERLNELRSIKFKHPELKRKISSFSSVDGLFRKKQNSTDKVASFKHMTEKRQTLDNLWRPLNLSEFAEVCGNGVKLGEEEVTLSCLLVVENWKSPYSKWLNTKFAFQVSAERSHYESEAKAGLLNIHFQSLPEDNLLKEDSFRNLPFLILESGILDDNQLEKFGNLQNKLIRDKTVLDKIARICDRFCHYKVQIMVLVWDSLGSGMSNREMNRLLGADEIKSGAIQNVLVCNMNSGEISVSEILANGLKKMAECFKGTFTVRGLKKRQQQKIGEKLLIKANSKNLNPEETLKSRENSILKKAREAQKHNYLLRHVSNPNRTFDLSNSSFQTAADTTLRANTFNNHTLVNLNNSFFDHSNTQRTRDCSILGALEGANVSVLEESTPFGSPRPKTLSIPRQPLPQKVQQLQDLVASIRGKYGKK